MTITDDRTPEQKTTHHLLVAMTDSFLSHWDIPGDRGGVSYAAWACKDGDEYRVERWVRQRGEAKRVRIVGNDWRPKGRGTAHIYVVTEEHPALR